jgi:hypothetical protein
MDDLKKEQSEDTSIRFKFLHVRTSRPEEFMDELDKLCERYSSTEDIFYKFSFDG